MDRQQCANEQETAELANQVRRAVIDVLLDGVRDAVNASAVMVQLYQEKRSVAESLERALCDAVTDAAVIVEEEALKAVVVERCYGLPTNFELEQFVANLERPGRSRRAAFQREMEAEGLIARLPDGRWYVTTRAEEQARYSHLVADAAARGGLAAGDDNSKK